MIFCRDKSRIIVEYALRDTSKPIGVSEYFSTNVLPDTLQPNFPTIEALEAELATISDTDAESAEVEE